MSRIEDRLAEDERRGDLGTARRRLCSLVATRGYDPGLIARIARLSVRMGDPVEAGRWYTIIDSADEQAPALIERFFESCGSPERAALAVPLRTSLIGVHPLPPAVRARLAPFILPRNPPPARRTPTLFDRLMDKLFGPGCLLITVAFIVCAVIGAVTVVRWIF